MDNRLFQLHYYGFICVSGADAETFLQGQLTCDVTKINDTQTQIGACCTNQGRVLSIFRLFKFNGDYYLRLPRDIIETTLNHLKKFAAFSKVKLLEVNNLITLGFQGDPSTLPVGKKDFFITNAPGNNRYEAYCHTDKASTFDMDLSDNKLWQMQNIEQMLCEIHPETIEKFTPHDLNLQLTDAVSFDKGCYQGQEIIARMHYRGKPKQHLYRAEVLSEADNLKPYLPIVTEDARDRTIGYIVDYVNLDKKTELLVSMKESATSKSCFVKADKQITIHINP